MVCEWWSMHTVSSALISRTDKNDKRADVCGLSGKIVPRFYKRFSFVFNSYRVSVRIAFPQIGNDTPKLQLCLARTVGYRRTTGSLTLKPVIFARPTWFVNRLRSVIDSPGNVGEINFSYYFRAKTYPGTKTNRRTRQTRLNRWPLLNGGNE